MLPRTKSQNIPNWGKWLIGVLLGSIVAAIILSSSVFHNVIDALPDLFVIVRGFGILFVLLALYVLPSIIARRTPRFAAILVLNLALGWTVLGWFAALIWALAEAGSLNKKQTPAV